MFRPTGGTREGPWEPAQGACGSNGNVPAIHKYRNLVTDEKERDTLEGGIPDEPPAMANSAAPPAAGGTPTGCAGAAAVVYQNIVPVIQEKALQGPISRKKSLDNGNCGNCRHTASSAAPYPPSSEYRHTDVAGWGLGGCWTVPGGLEFSSAAVRAFMRTFVLSKACTHSRAHGNCQPQCSLGRAIQQPTRRAARVLMMSIVWTPPGTGAQEGC